LVQQLGEKIRQKYASSSPCFPFHSLRKINGRRNLEPKIVHRVARIMNADTRFAAENNSLRDIESERKRERIHRFGLVA
jgi:hypothetical protein